MKKRIILSIYFLILGVLIYFLFDIKIISKDILVFSIIRNYLPDLCWTMSFFFLSITLTSNITNKPLLINSLYVLTISLLYEFLQFVKLAKGTFDIGDIFIYIISIIFACLIEKMIRRKKYEKIT